MALCRWGMFYLFSSIVLYIYYDMCDYMEVDGTVVLSLEKSKLSTDLLYLCDRDSECLPPLPVFYMLVQKPSQLHIP